VPLAVEDVKGSADAAAVAPKDDLDAAGFWGWGHGWGYGGGYGGWGGYGYPYYGRSYYSWPYWG